MYFSNLHSVSFFHSCTTQMPHTRAPHPSYPFLFQTTFKPVWFLIHLKHTQPHAPQAYLGINATFQYIWTANIHGTARWQQIFRSPSHGYSAELSRLLSFCTLRTKSESFTFLYSFLMDDRVPKS